MLRKSRTPYHQVGRFAGNNGRDEVAGILRSAGTSYILDKLHYDTLDTPRAVKRPFSSISLQLVECFGCQGWISIGGCCIHTRLISYVNGLPQYGQVFQSSWAGFPQLEQVRVGVAIWAGGWDCGC